MKSLRKKLLRIPERIVYTDGSIFYYQKGNHIIRSRDINKRDFEIDRIRFGGALQNNRIMSRLFRLGIQDLIKIDDQRSLVISGNRIIKINHAQNKQRTVFIIERGSRPLFLAKDNNNRIYFGEYFNNKYREEVHVFSSDHGNSFRSVYKFPKGKIRHVHGIFFDHYEDLLWITTGDSVDEAIIWVTDDLFETLTPLARTRAVQLLFTEGYVYYGTDYPRKQNHIYRINKSDKNVEKLQEVQGPIFYGCKSGEHLIFSTVVEPLAETTNNCVYLWATKTGKIWKCIDCYKKDQWHSKIFQYGQILFPSGQNLTNTLWFTPFATKNDQTIQQINLEKFDL